MHKPLRFLFVLALLSVFGGSAAMGASDKFQQGTLPVSHVTVPVNCPGALPLTFGGALIYRAHIVPVDGGYNAAVQTRLDGLTATDSAGNTYTFQGVGNAQVRLRAGGTAMGVGVGNLTAVGSGPDSGIHGHVTVDISIDSAGNISLTFDSIRAICR